MKVEQSLWTRENDWEEISSVKDEVDFQLVIIFGASKQVTNEQLL